MSDQPYPYGESPFEDNPQPYDPEKDEFGWEGCPMCGSLQATFHGEATREDGKCSSRWKCQSCDHIWLENNWTW